MIIGLTGKARSGKNTFADYLAASADGYDQFAECFALADPIKAMIDVMGLFPRRYWEERKEEVIDGLGVSPRYLAQTLGTEWGREIVHQDLWIISLRARMKQSDADVKVVTDVRFDNEAKAVKEMGGVIVEIRREAAPEVLDHASEKGVRKELIDYVIENDSGLSELDMKAMDLFDKVATEEKEAMKAHASAREE